MDSTKKQIIRYLQSRKSATVKEISEALHLTKANIRHHLNNLIEDGKIVACEELFSGHIGRPAKKFCLSLSAQPNNYMSVCHAIAKLFSRHPALSQMQEDFLEAIASELLPGEDHQTPSPVISRLNHAIAVFNTNHYDAHWEASRNGAIIVFEHCPYLQSAREFDFYCRLDKLLVEKFSGHKAIPRQTIIDRNQSGMHKQCVFTLE